jgi:hypothetical protein
VEPLGLRRVDAAGALWPNELQAAAIRRRIAQGEPVLVVVETPETSVKVLADQLAQAPPELAAAAERDVEIADVRIRAFDWLPEDLRERGLAFLRSNDERARRIPASLLAPAVLDASGGHVRFLHVTRPWEQLELDLGAIARLAFGARLRAVA